MTSFPLSRWMPAAARMCVLLLAALMSMSNCGPPRPEEAHTMETPARSYAELKNDLKSPEWSVRSQAVLEIGQQKYKQAAPDLMILLEKDPHLAVRQTSALVLADFGEKRAAPIVASQLANGLGDPDVLLEVLQRFADPAYAYVVLPYLDSSQHILRLKAVAVLDAMKAKNQGDAILAMARRSTDPEKAKTYAMALGKLEVRQAESYLIGLARTAEAGPTLAATYHALGHIKSLAGVPILVQALAADFPKGRDNAVDALLEIKSVSALPLAFGLIEHEREDTRIAAAEVISGIPAPDSGPRALAVLQKREAKSLGPASYILGRLKYTQARLPIENILSDRRSPEREKLARSLGWMGEKASVPVLIHVLGESDGEGRYGAAWSLGIMKPEEAFEPLLNAAKSSDAKLKSLAVEALGSYQSERALPILTGIMENDAALRFYAIESITAIPGEEASKVLERHLDSGDPRLRQAVLLAIGKRKEKRSLPALMNLLEEEEMNPEVRDSLFSALREITGENISSRGKWLEWYKKQ